MIEVREGTWQTPHGHAARFRYREGTNDYGVIQSILTHDEYAIPEGLTGRALDVGAHIGGWSIAAALDNPGLSVTAIEPVPENAVLLRENIALNGLGDRVEVREAAAGKNKVIRYNFTGSADGDVHRFIGNQGMAPNVKHDTLTVPVAGLRSFGKVRLMKIDCEGCEWSFLDSSAIGRVAEIVGEYHGLSGAAGIYGLLAETHRVEIRETSDGFGLFRAVAR